MFKWYRNNVISKHFRKLETGMIDTSNYMHVSELLLMVVKDIQTDILPKELYSVKVTLSTHNGMELLSNFKKANNLLKKGEIVKIHSNPSKVKMVDWTTDGADRPLILDAYLLELSATVVSLTSLLNDIGSNSESDLEYYINTLASIMMDVVKVCKILK